MSRVVFLAMGSLGDVRPHLALGLRLQRDGHEVIVMAMDDFATEVARVGLDYASLNVSYDSASVLAHRCITHAMATTTAAAMAGVIAWSRSYAHAMAEAIDAVVEPDDTVVTGLMAVDVATALVRARGVHAALAMFSATSPTADGAASVAPAVPGRRSVLNRLSMHSGYALGLTLSRAPGNAMRRRLGLLPRSVADAGRDAEALLTFIATSRLLAPPADDRPLHTHVTGPWVSADEDDWVPPADLAAFLAGAEHDGRPVAYVGFGSSLSPDPSRDAALVAEAARAAAVRVVWQAPSTLVHRTPSSAALLPAGDVLVIPGAPHAWLFGRMNAVIHHGGAGTTVAGLRSGVPSAIVAHALDQPYHLRRLAALGVGPGGLRRRQLDARRLRDLLIDLVYSPAADGYRERAREAAAIVRAEDGAAVAARLLRRNGMIHGPAGC